MQLTHHTLQTPHSRLTHTPHPPLPNAQHTCIVVDRLVKLYKIASQRRREKKMLEDIEHLVEQGRIDEEEIDRYFNKMQSQTQSKVGSELSDSITRRVISIVLLLLVTVPFLTNEEMNPSYSSATSYMEKVSESYQESIDRGVTPNCFEITQAMKTFLQIDPLKIRMSPNPLEQCGDYPIGSSSFSLNDMVANSVEDESNASVMQVILNDSWSTLRNQAIDEDIITSEVS